jgi:hypothetical protein
LPHLGSKPEERNSTEPPKVVKSHLSSGRATLVNKRELTSRRLVKDTPQGGIIFKVPWDLPSYDLSFRII